MSGFADRTTLMIGEDGVEKLRNASVIVAGVGAVGGYALEGLVRAGFGRIRVVDGDVFQGSNLNRQILATTATIGRPKADVACERAGSINPDVGIEGLRLHVSDETLDEILAGDFEILVDAIDTVRCKIRLLQRSSETGIRTFSSMGAARRFETTRVHVSALEETRVCPLARAVRSGMRGYDTSNMTCVWSDEPPAEVGEERDEHGKGVLGSLPTVPAVFGMTLANEAIRHVLTR